jgi:hypothetical protein
VNSSASAAPPAQCVKCINGTISDRFDAQACRYVISYVHWSVVFSDQKPMILYNRLLHS